VREDLDGRIAMILDGGAATIGLESTVLDLTGTAPRILRPGGITVEALREVLPGIELAPSYVDPARGSPSPGQLLKHYSPRAQVLLFHGEDPARIRSAMLERARREAGQNRSVGMLVTDEDAAALAALHGEAGLLVQRLGAASDLNGIGRELFANMRDLDARGVDVILVRDPGRHGLGAALWDRLLRAAEGRLLQA
jgi:L-threonylcarbamoyladenylate synthase